VSERPDRSSGGLRSRWRSGEVTVGGWCVIPNSFSAEIMGRAGFDWVCVDAQHGMISDDTLGHMAQGLAVSGTPLLVRVVKNDPAVIGKVLDTGATGVVVPMVNSAADAASAVRACRYAPVGTRSWATSHRAGISRSGYNPTDVNKATLAVVQVETPEAVAHLEEILSVEGLDGVFVGPGDLGVSLGFDPAKGTPPELREVIEIVLKACLAKGIYVGIACPNVEAALTWRDLGFTALAIASDARFLTQAARQTVRSFREAGTGQ